MSRLKESFLALLPENQASRPAAQEEAKWLADTAVAQSASIARKNKVVLFGWLNNILVNSNLRDRGLCWEVQQDLYRDLRRRPVKYFRVGLVVLTQEDREGDKWEEDWREPYVSSAYPEGHSYDMQYHLVWPGWTRKRNMFQRMQAQKEAPEPAAAGSASGN